MVGVLSILRRLYSVTKCFICNKPVLDHSEGNLHGCLIKSNKFITELIPLMEKVLILNGAGARFRDGGYHHT